MDSKYTYFTISFARASLFICGALCVSYLFSIHSAKAEQAEKIPPQVIVKLKQPERGAQSTLNRAAQIDDSIKIVDSIDEQNVALVEDTTERRDLDELMRDLKKNENVEIVEPNLPRTFAYIPNDVRFGDQWAHKNTGQSVNGSSGTNGADIDSTTAWDKESSTATSTIIAVIDTGVEYTHVDLAANMWDGTNCKDDFNIAVNGGCPNHGWNYENGNNDPIDSGQSNPSYTGHGTFAASMIGAVSSNNQGISGTSRHNSLEIMALRFNFDVFTEIKAINFAKHNGAKVINASYGGGGFSQIESDAIADFPGIVVAASGNGGADFVGDDNDTTPFYPCNYDLENVICVGATNQNDQLASFSNYGASNVDIAAPGVNVLGIYRGEYLYGNGTSFAAPLVSAAAGLIYAHNPSLTTTQVKNTILTQSDAVTALNGKITESRRLNTTKIINATAPDVPQPSDPNQQNTYRFYSPVFQGHFYTTSESERNLLISSDPNWNYEGIAFTTYKNATNSSIKPVYRFYSDTFNGHFYTISESEKNGLIANDPNWKFEGTAYYAQTTQAANTKPLYRFWSPIYKHHFFTVSSTERDGIIANDPNWSYEGVAYYLPQ